LFYLYSEVIRDFFIGMELYASFDGEPAAAEIGGSEIDYGIRTTVGLKF